MCNEDNEYIEIEIETRELDLNDPEELASLDRAQGYLEEFINKQQDDALIINNADNIRSVFSILVCGRDNLVLVNLQLYNGDMNPINESYRTYSVSWKQARETFDSYGMDGWEDANLDNDVKLEMSSEILAENIWEFIEDVRSELNLQNMRIAMPKDLPVLDSNNEWAIVFGKFLHKEIFDIIENIELVDISTEELYEE